MISKHYSCLKSIREGIEIIEKITAKKISEHASEQIEGLIRQGNYQAGEKLPSVRELCGMFGIGRSAVRDALTVLKGKGMIDIRQGEGAYVCGFDSSKLLNQAFLPVKKKDVAELFQVRKLIEPGIAELAAANRSDRQLLLMKNTLTLSGWQEDYEFHRIIAEASANGILIQLTQFISQALKSGMEHLYGHISADLEALALINSQHSELYSHIHNREGRKAYETMSEHLQAVEKLFDQYVIQEHFFA